MTVDFRIYIYSVYWYYFDLMDYRIVDYKIGYEN